MRTALLVAAFLALAAPASAAPLSVTVTRDGVTATLRGDAVTRDDDAPVLRMVRGLELRIDGGGAQLAGTLPACRPDCGERAGRASASLAVRDLEGDGRPEVLVQRFTEGDLCCSGSVTVVRLRAQWEPLRPVRLGSAVQLRDLDRDGRPELVADDHRFFARFGPRVLGSTLPPRYYAYRDGVFVDVTRAHPAAVRRARAPVLRMLRRVPRDAVRAWLPPAMAADHLLGAHRTAERRLREQVRRGAISRRLATSIRRFLRRAGYCAGCVPPAAIDARLPGSA